MVIYRKAEKGKYAASRTPTGNLLVGRRHGKTTARVARDEKAQPENEEDEGEVTERKKGNLSKVYSITFIKKKNGRMAVKVENSKEKGIAGISLTRKEANLVRNIFDMKVKEKEIAVALDLTSTCMGRKKTSVMKVYSFTGTDDKPKMKIVKENSY